MTTQQAALGHDADTIRAAVRERYAAVAVAAAGTGCCTPATGEPSCCGGDAAPADPMSVR
jgi:hypothetical protein